MSIWGEGCSFRSNIELEHAASQEEKRARLVGKVRRGALAGSGNAQNLGIFRPREEKTPAVQDRSPETGHEGEVSHVAEQEVGGEDCPSGEGCFQPSTLLA